MNTTDIRSIHSVEHEGFFYVVTNDGIFAKGCQRCGGTGHYSFNGLDSICYLCNNFWEARLGDIFETEADAQKWCHGKALAKARRDAKRDEVRLAKLAKRSAAWDALEAAHPGVWALLTSVVDVRAYDQPEGNIYPNAAERDAFVLQLADQLWKLDEWPFTERQIAALQRVAERRAERATEAAAHPAPTGRAVVTGEIVSAKAVEGDYGTTYKILVKDDQGFKVWCSLPKAQVDQAFDEWHAEHPEHYTWGPDCWLLGADGTDEQGVKGRRITFTATLEPSRDDKSFAFGKRPTKGAWL
ncbi:hypothetical protein SEA_LUNA18_32 [Microbacterium phage Luna18]|nr:hypothetical protein SEA_KATCHAN_32 [Microbacterium phage KatChan]URQ04883.1 hypothetical protein SEA_LUNA18_32 [Microbacterium phage Luna18]